MLIGKPPNNFANKFSWIALVPTTIIPIDSKSYYPQLTAQQWWFKFQKYLRRGYWKVPISVGWYGCFFSYMFDSKNQTFFRDFWFSVFGRHFSYIFDVRSVQSGRRKPKTKKRFCFSTQCSPTNRSRKWSRKPKLVFDVENGGSKTKKHAPFSTSKSKGRKAKTSFMVYRCKQARLLTPSCSTHNWLPCQKKLARRHRRLSLCNSKLQSRVGRLL